MSQDNVKHYSFAMDPNGETYNLKLSGKVTIQNSLEIKEEVKKIYILKPANVNVDLSECELLDSTGLGMLLSLFTYVSKADKKMTLSKPNDFVMRLLQYSKLDKIISVI